MAPDPSLRACPETKVKALILHVRQTHRKEKQPLEAATSSYPDVTILGSCPLPRCLSLCSRTRGRTRLPVGCPESPLAYVSVGDRLLLLPRALPSSSCWGPLPHVRRSVVTCLHPVGCLCAPAVECDSRGPPRSCRCEVVAKPSSLQEKLVTDSSPETRVHARN